LSLIESNEFRKRKEGGEIFLWGTLTGKGERSRRRRNQEKEQWLQGKGVGHACGSHHSVRAGYYGEGGQKWEDLAIPLDPKVTKEGIEKKKKNKGGGEKR